MVHKGKAWTYNRIFLHFPLTPPPLPPNVPAFPPILPGEPLPVQPPPPHCAITNKNIVFLTSQLIICPFFHEASSCPLLHRGPEDQGGYGLVMPHTYLYWQNALAFVSYVTGHSLLLAVVARPFERWCVAVGFVPQAQYLFLLQLGRVRWAHMPYLALKAKSFSKARQGLPVIMPEDFSVDSMPA